MVNEYVTYGERLPWTHTVCSLSGASPRDQWLAVLQHRLFPIHNSCTPFSVCWNEKSPSWSTLAPGTVTTPTAYETSVTAIYATMSPLLPIETMAQTILWLGFVTT